MITKEELKNIRINHNNLTIKKCASMIGVSERTWQRWEAGKTKINYGLVELFIIKLGVNGCKNGENNQNSI